MITRSQAMELAAKVLKCKLEELRNMNDIDFAFWGIHGDGVHVDKETGRVHYLPAPGGRL